MIVLRHGFTTYIPRLTLRSCLILDKLYGSITAPILNSSPSLYDLCYILSLCIGEDDEDIVYDIVDTIDNLYELILEIYVEAGLIDTKQGSNDSEEQETMNNDELEDDISFYDYIEDMRQQCMNIGMSREDFYNSTLKEMQQLIESLQAQNKQDLEQRAMMDYTLASLIRIGTASILSNSVEFPDVQTTYPFLDEEQQVQEVEVTDKKERVLGVVDKESWDDGLTPEQRAEEIAYIRRLEQIDAMNKKQKEKQEQELKESVSSE